MNNPSLRISNGAWHITLPSGKILTETASNHPGTLRDAPNTPMPPCVVGAVFLKTRGSTAAAAIKSPLDMALRRLCERVKQEGGRVGFTCTTTEHHAKTSLYAEVVPAIATMAGVDAVFLNAATPEQAAQRALRAGAFLALNAVRIADWKTSETRASMAQTLRQLGLTGAQIASVQDPTTAWDTVQHLAVSLQKSGRIPSHYDVEANLLQTRWITQANGNGHVVLDAVADHNQQRCEVLRQQVARDNPTMIVTDLATAAPLAATCGRQFFALDAVAVSPSGHVTVKRSDHSKKQIGPRNAHDQIEAVLPPSTATTIMQSVSRIATMHGTSLARVLRLDEYWALRAYYALACQVPAARQTPKGLQLPLVGCSMDSLHLACFAHSNAPQEWRNVLNTAGTSIR